MHFLLATAAAAGLASAMPSSSFAVHERREGKPIAWTKEGTANKNMPIPVRIGLKQRNLDNLMDYVMDISDPDSPNFGNSLLTKNTHVNRVSV